MGRIDPRRPERHLDPTGQLEIVGEWIEPLVGSRRSDAGPNIELLITEVSERVVAGGRGMRHQVGGGELGNDARLPQIENSCLDVLAIAHPVGPDPFDLLDRQASRALFPDHPRRIMKQQTAEVFVDLARRQWNVVGNRGRIPLHVEGGHRRPELGRLGFIGRRQISR